MREVEFFRCSVQQFCNYLITFLQIKTSLSVASITSTIINDTYLKADTGASKNFIREQDQHFLQNIKQLRNGLSAKLPNNQCITPTSTGNLSLNPTLSTTAQSALVYPALKNLSLLSIGQLCDDDCLAVFHTKNYGLLKTNKLF